MIRRRYTLYMVTTTNDGRVLPGHPVRKFWTSRGAERYGKLMEREAWCRWRMLSDAMVIRD